VSRTVRSMHVLPCCRQRSACHIVARDSAVGVVVQATQSDFWNFGELGGGLVFFRLRSVRSYEPLPAMDVPEYDLLGCGGQRADSRGFFGMPSPQAISLDEFQRSVDDSWFTSTSAFIARALTSRVEFPSSFPDSPVTRGVILWSSFGMVPIYTKCECGQKVKLKCYQEADRCSLKLSWECCSGGHKSGHFRQTLHGVGILENVNVSSWTALLHMIVLLRANTRWVNIESEMLDAYGISDHHTLRDWRRRYQDNLRRSLNARDALCIGGDKQTVVWDETIIGEHKGINTGSGRTRSSSRSTHAVAARVLRRLPGRTVWKQVCKRRAANMKKPAASVSKRPSGCIKRPAAFISKRPAGAIKRPAGGRDLRRTGRWLWMAVSVGCGKELYTHENQKKRVTFELLPRPEDAPQGKPRGLRSMAPVIKRHIKAKSFCIFDGWRTSKRAALDLGYRFAPPVNHSQGWRDRATGYHSNDIESENSRFKSWLRARYTKLRLALTACTEGGDDEVDEVKSMDALDLYEYVHYVNIGGAMSDVASSFVTAAGMRSGYPRLKIV
jgi:transposase-like protein